VIQSLGHFKCCGLLANPRAAKDHFRGTIAFEISSRNARVAALEKRWNRLRAGLDLIPDQRGADMADLPGGASGLLARDYKGKEADPEINGQGPTLVRRRVLNQSASLLPRSDPVALG
jgi:hypothetical protein